ncbi:unnamed protein product [Arctogadus glacialis]
MVGVKGYGRVHVTMIIILFLIYKTKTKNIFGEKDKKKKGELAFFSVHRCLLCSRAFTVGPGSLSTPLSLRSLSLSSISLLSISLLSLSPTLSSIALLYLHVSPHYSKAFEANAHQLSPTVFTALAASPSLIPSFHLYPRRRRVREAL